MCDNSIKKCDANIWKELHRNTALAGVSTMFPGWDTWLENVVNNHALFDSDMVITPPMSLYWCGKGVRSSFAIDVQGRVGQEGEFDESCRDVVLKKCSDSISFSFNAPFQLL